MLSITLVVPKSFIEVYNDVLNIPYNEAAQKSHIQNLYKEYVEQSLIEDENDYSDFILEKTA